MSHPWWRITVDCTPEARDEVAAFLVRLTGEAVEESATGAVYAIARDPADAERVVTELGRTYPDAVGVIAPQAPIDWAVHWRDGIITRHFGRIVITPSWLPVTPEGEAVVLVIDPESAFGNGEHGSTRVALALLDRHLKAGDRVIDLGSGSGVLAIGASLLGAASAIGIEVDPEAIPIAEANAVRNGVEQKTRFVAGDAAELASLAGPAQLVCSNILRTVNTRLLPIIAASLAPGGRVIFSGMELGEADSFRAALAQDWQIIDEASDSGWWGVVVTRA